MLHMLAAVQGEIPDTMLTLVKGLPKARTKQLIEQRNKDSETPYFHLANPQAGPDHSHNEWLKEKADGGWKYGPVKDPEAKEHPCFVPYEELPTEQKAKDFLFRGVVHAMAAVL